MSLLLLFWFLQAPAVIHGEVPVTITATDENGIAWVEFWMDTTLVQRFTSPPYTLLWNTRVQTDGAHTLVAKAADTVGNVGVSPNLDVVLFNQGDVQPPRVTINVSVATLTVGGKEVESEPLGSTLHYDLVVPAQEQPTTWDIQVTYKK